MLDKLKSTLLRSEEFVFYALLAFASAVLMLELRSLYSTPIPDSYLWWGDESWLMLEFRSQMMHGVFQHPYALGSSLAHGSGFVLGNMWLPAIFYGAPAAFVSPTTMDIVLLGRTVTAVFAFTLLVVLYEFIRRITEDRLLAIFGTLLLASSRSFLFTSHSARYDILTALAILSGLYILLRRAKPLTLRGSFIAGVTLAATTLITIHVTLELSIAVLLYVLLNRSAMKLKSLASFVIGAAAFLGVLALIAALRGQLTAFGSGTSNAFALNLHDIPIFRIYSRSVQAANLAQKWATFSSLGAGYLVAFGIIALLVVVALLRKRPIRFSQPVALILAVAFAWFEFESAAPTSYLIYILPVLSFGAAIALAKLIPEYARIPLLALGSIALFFMALKDTPGPHGKGFRIMTANYQAVGAALNEIEQVDSSKPLVLAFNPAVHEVLRDSNMRLMTTHFVEFPDSAMSVDSVIRHEGVQYVLIYRSAIKPDYMREVGPISDALTRLGTPLWERAGSFTDIGRSYFDAAMGPPDTLQLYHIHD